MKFSARAAGVVLLLGSGLACATSRRVVSPLTANCHEVLPGIAFEMMRDSPRLLVLDVRHPREFREGLGHLPRAKEVPLSELPRRYGELSAWRKESVVIFSRDGSDAASACEFLSRQGFLNVSHIAGGVEQWQRQKFGQMEGRAE